MLDLRTGLAAPSDLLNYADEGLAASYRAIDAAGANPIKRGWVSTSEGLQGSDLLAQANAAERAGDMLRAQQLELQAQDHMQRAQTWAPTTQNFTDIDGMGAAANWVGGQVGSGARSMIAPLAGGVGGRVLGGIAGGLIAGPGGAAIGANLGGLGGAFVPSNDMQYNESVGQSMMDPEIRAKRTAEEIHRTGQGVGAVGGALDAIVPAGIAKVGMGGLAKRSIGNVIAREAGEEFLTEGAQRYVGQTGQNQLAGRELTDYDHLEAFNAAMAGAVGGGVMGGAGAAVGAARDKLAAGAEKVADVARDPVQSAVDAVHRVVKGDPIKRADREIAEFEAGRRPLSKMFDDERATANDERIFDAPKADEPDAQVSARMREDIDRWADRILTAKPRELGPREEELRSAAAQYKSDGDWMKLRGVLRKNKLMDERNSMMNSFEPEGVRASEMTPEGQELDTLSSAWLKNEGKRYGEYFADGSDEAKGLGAKLFAWIKNDFGAKMTDDGEIFIPRAFIEALGDRAPGVIESAITAARKEGWDIKNAGDAVATIREYVNSNEGDTSFLTSAIRYSQQENWTPKMIQRFAKELRQKGGRLDKDDYRWLKTQVSDIVGVLDHFQKPSRFYKAEKNMGMKSDSGLTQAARDQDEKAGITENDGEWGSGVSEVDPSSTRTYPKLTESEFFDVRDPTQRSKLEALEKAEAAKGKGASVNRPVRVGILDRTLEKVAGDRGVSVEALPTQTRDKVMRDLVHEYFPSFERLPAEPKNLSEFAKQQYAKRKSEYATGLKRRANLLNQKLVTIGVDQIAMEKLGTQIEARDVHMKNADSRDPKYGAARGTLILRTYNKEGKATSRPFVTSTQMIVAKMFRAKDSNGASTKRYEGTSQGILQLLSDGVTSVVQDKRFGGDGKAMRIGTLKNGEPQWFDSSDIRTWPKNLVIFRGKDNRPYTLGEALEQEKQQSLSTVSFDFDLDDVDPGRNDKVREKKYWEKRQELKALLENGADKATRAKIVQALRAKGEDGKPNNEPVEFLWNELVESGVLKSSETVTEIGSTRGDRIEEGQVGPDDLSAYDPNYIKRDERGDMLSSSTEYSAQSRIGTSKKVDPKDAAKFDPATKVIPGVGRGSGVEIRMEEVRQRFVDLMRKSVQAVLDAVVTMAPKDLALFETAFAEFAKLSSANVDTLAKEYFQGDKNAARMFTTRLMRSNVAVRDAIDARGEVNNSGQLPGSKEKANGEARQADTGGEETGVVAQPGRERATENSELGAGQQGRNAEDGVVAKQDAWVMKFASMSKKDMRAFIASLPTEKLSKVFSALNVFHPADNSNPFWQRNDLDNYTDAKSDVVFEAQDLIRDRLNEDGGVARVFAQDRQPTVRQAEVLGKHYSDIEFKIATSKAEPLRLDAFHKVAKRVDPEFGLLGYAEQNSKKLRAWAEGARGFLLDLGFPVSDTRILFTDGDDNTLGAHFGDVDAILLDKNVFEKALSGDKIEQANLPLLLTHEASHALDNGVWDKSTGNSPRPSTKNQRFIVSKEYTIGDIGQEILDVYNSRGEYWDHFAYPVSPKHDKHLNPKDKVREGFAQLLTIYALDPSWSEKHTPKFFQLAQEIDNAATLKDVATIISGGTIDWTKFAAPDGENPRANRRVDSRATGRVGRDTGIAGESRPEIRLGLREGSLAGGVTKNSEQTTSDFKQIDPEQALADIARMLGKDFDAKVVKKLGGKAGTWTPGVIKLATSAADGTQFHEALHELFNQMRTHGAANVAQIIERVANSPLILRKLEQLLEGHPKAAKQLKTPEEAAAYLFQFWNMGLINVGPETKSLFQTIKDLIVNAAKELHSWINAAKRDERKAEKAQKMDEAEVRRLFEALAGGAAATSDVNVRQALYDGLRKNIEAHTKKVEELGQQVEGFWQGLGRYVVTSESMLNLYSKHPELKTVADKFHQMAGKSMKNQARNRTLKAYGGLIEAKHLEVQRRLNPFERFLMDGQYDEKDMALAAKHLEANTQSGDKKIQALVDYLHGYYSEMYDYMVQSDVRRLDPHSEERWVPIQKRKDYSTQSWSIEELTKDHDGFVSTLLKKHAKELAHMAQQANAEIAAWNKDPKTQVESATAKVELDAAKEQKRAAQEITPEMIAEQIYVRLLNSTGMVDIQETNWSLGLTPAAGAVNRRELDWLDKEAFSKYKSKDLVEIVTNYTRTMVARAEYQKRFGYGGEVIGDAMDTAMLREIGGQALVDSATASLDGEIKRWKKEARAWYKDNPGVPYPEPYPTLRLVGIQQHRAQVGADASNEALIKAEETLRPAVNAVRALEGTLGNDISPAMRSFNSWINTYQNVRLLPLALFTNFSDVIGITVQGGTLGDAWNAFTAGMREVRNTWVNEKGTDAATLRAEEWGVSDAGAMLDTLGQNYSSVYMTEKARNINNKFFRIIGMEGWNRGVRITATAVGERIIGDWVKNGVDAKKPGEKARFERLFGEGADPKKIKLDAQGNLDTQDAANRAAIQRFVQDAVMSSNSAVRAIWMSDPRMATFAHLKNFAYAFHSVMLKGVLAQTAEGNLRPALVAGLGFASISIAAAAVKEMLIPGDEPYWMKGGLDGYLEYGYGMANLGGVPQMYLESVTDFDPAKLAGPFWDQIQNTLSSPIPGFSINLSPVDGETEILRDRKVLVELAKGLPAGNLAGRAMDSVVGD